MNFDRTGIILYTIEYEKCVDFYENTLELKKLFVGETLTCFALGDTYLLVEVDDEYDGTQKEPERIKTCLRMNVPNVKEYAERLISKNIEVKIYEHSWGTVAKFLDPDGNLCAFKDSDKFEKQIIDFKQKSQEKKKYSS